MKSIFIPKQIHAGYQNRADTYTKKLAYVIYTDNKQVKRKETSWLSWLDDSIPKQDFVNTPTEGFVLNKKAGGTTYHWNTRKTVARVYDPRGFEIEISIDNLLYILSYTNSIKGKGLEGEFVYGWDGTELLLLPVDTQDYRDSKSYSDTLFTNKTIKAKELQIGHEYTTKKSIIHTYLGKHTKLDEQGILSKPMFCFATKNTYYSPKSIHLSFKVKFTFNWHKTITGKFIEESDEISSRYTELLELMPQEYSLQTNIKVLEVSINEADILSLITENTEYNETFRYIGSNYNAGVYPIGHNITHWSDTTKRLTKEVTVAPSYNLTLIPIKDFIREYKPMRREIYSNNKLIKTLGPKVGYSDSRTSTQTQHSN